MTFDGFGFDLIVFDAHFMWFICDTHLNCHWHRTTYTYKNETSTVQYPIPSFQIPTSCLDKHTKLCTRTLSSVKEMSISLSTNRILNGGVGRQQTEELLWVPRLALHYQRVTIGMLTLHCRGGLDLKPMTD